MDLHPTGAPFFPIADELTDLDIPFLFLTDALGGATVMTHETVNHVVRTKLLAGLIVSGLILGYATAATWIMDRFYGWCPVEAMPCEKHTPARREWQP